MRSNRNHDETSLTDCQQRNAYIDISLKLVTARLFSNIAFSTFYKKRKHFDNQLLLKQELKTMNLIKKLFVGLALITAISGCTTTNSIPFTNYTVFTEDLRRDLENAGIPLSKVQFFNDKAITIRREVSDPNDIKVNPEGKISINNGKSIQTINVRLFTPGVALGSSSGAISVSWDDTQTDKKGMKFNLSGQNYFLDILPSNKFNYKDRTFDIQSGNGARLFVSKDLLKQVNNQRETLKGRKVGQ